MTPAQYKAWLRRDGVRRVVLVEIDYMYQVGAGESATPTKGTLRLGNYPFVASLFPGDESPGTPTLYDGAILQAPDFERSLDRTTLRGRYNVSVGDVVINNANRDYDFVLGLALDGSECRVYIGDASWRYEDFLLLFSAVQLRAYAPSPERINIALRDTGLLLNKSIGGEEPIGGTGPEAEKVKPLPFGYVHQMAPVLRDTETAGFRYVYSENDTNLAAAVREVRADGFVLGVGADYVDNADGTFTLINNPNGSQITCDVIAHRAVTSATNYRVSDALRYFVGDRAGLYALGKYGGAHPSYTAPVEIPYPVDDYHCGILIEEKRNVVDLLDEIMNTANGFWAVKRTGEWYYGRMQPQNLAWLLSAMFTLPSDAVPKARIGRDDVIKGGPVIEHRAPTYRAYQNYANRNWTQQTSFAGALTAEERSRLTRKGLYSEQFTGEEPGTAAYFGVDDPSLGGAPELYHLTLSDSQAVDTLISGQNDTDVIDPAAPRTVPDYQAIWNAERRAQFLPWTEFVDISTFLDFYDLEIGDIVMFTYPRWELDQGALHQVDRVKFLTEQARMELGFTRRRYANVLSIPPNFELREDDGLELDEDVTTEVRN